MIKITPGTNTISTRLNFANNGSKKKQKPDYLLQQQQEKPLFQGLHQIRKETKKLVLVLTISALMTRVSIEEFVGFEKIQQVFYSQYQV